MLHFVKQHKNALKNDFTRNNVSENGKRIKTQHHFYIKKI